MTLSEAKELLNSCVREELRDHAFGDAEVFWSKDEKKVAEGYFNGGNAGVWFYDILVSDGTKMASFSGEKARELRECGAKGHISRNDETGPEQYVEGYTMPGLTAEGVRKELTDDGS